MSKMRAQVNEYEAKRFQTHKEIRAEGGVFYWSLGNESSFALLESGFNKIGVGHMTPERNTPSAALKSALVKFCLSRKTTIEAVGKGYQVTVLIQSKMNGTPFVDHRPAFVVFPPPSGGCRLELKDPHTGLEVEDSVLDGLVDNTYIVNMRAKHYGTQSGHPKSHLSYHSCLSREYQRQSDFVPGSKVARSLVKLIGMSQGVSLKDNGGIYWVSNDHMHLWNMVRAVVECASDSNKMYGLHTIIDESLCSAVCDALTSNVVSELETIEKELAAGFKQERALKARQQRAAELREKVQEYSKLLGVALDELESRTEKTDAAAAFATLAVL